MWPVNTSIIRLKYPHSPFIGTNNRAKISLFCSAIFNAACRCTFNSSNTRPDRRGEKFVFSKEDKESIVSVYVHWINTVCSKQLLLLPSRVRETQTNKTCYGKTKSLNHYCNPQPPPSHPGWDKEIEDLEGK